MRTRCCIVVALLALSLGCGSSEPFQYVPAKGRVIYENGSPVPLGGARLLFFVQDVGASGEAVPRPALANLNAQGEFDVVTSHKYGDGLIPGKHKVVIQADAVRDGNQIFPDACTNVLFLFLFFDTAELPLVIKVPKP